MLRQNARIFRLPHSGVPVDDDAFKLSFRYTFRVTPIVHSGTQNTANALLRRALRVDGPSRHSRAEPPLLVLHETVRRGRRLASQRAPHTLAWPQAWVTSTRGPKLYSQRHYLARNPYKADQLLPSPTILTTRYRLARAR